MGTRLFFALLLLFSSSMAVADQAAPAQLTDAQIAKLPPEYQRLNQYVKEFQAKGIPNVRLVSFGRSGKNVAITKIVGKPGSEDAIYIASVDDGDMGKFIYFKTFNDCTPSAANAPMPQETIQVDGQAVNVFAFCAPTESKGRSQQGFLPSSDEGKAILFNAFSTKKFVFVKFQAMEVAFETDGFDVAWKMASVPGK
jgi:hypothetical protein